MRKFLVILFIFISKGVHAQEEVAPISNFKSCQRPLMLVKEKPIMSLVTPTESGDADCLGKDPVALPSLGEMNDFLEDYAKYQLKQPLPDSEMRLLSQVNKRVKFLSKVNLKQLQMQRDCFVDKTRQGCADVRSQITQSIQENWHDMNLGLVLGFQKNSAVRYNFGADKPDLFIFGSTKHPFGGKVQLDNGIKEEAQKIFATVQPEFGSMIDSGLREHLQETYKTKYVDAMLKAPIMGMLKSRNPSEKEIISALDEMIENNQDLIDEEFDANDLAGFHPIIEQVLEEQPQLCDFADHWIKEKQNRDDNLRLVKMGLAGVGCVASAWTGVGLSLCFASGALLAGEGVATSYQNKKFERTRAFTSALDSKMIDSFDGLSAAEQDFALELAMAPLAGLGAGRAFRSIVPPPKVVSWVKSTKPTAPVQVAKEESSPVLRSLEEDVRKVRDEYRNAPKDVDVQVCNIGVAAYQCDRNVMSLLKHAMEKYPDFDLSKARVLRIQPPKEVPLLANNATRPAGFEATFAPLKEFSKKARTEADGATTWSRHYVLEYEGKILDFDYADDIAPTTAQYFEKMFSDTLNGVVKPKASSTYLVRPISAQEYIQSEKYIDIFSTTSAGKGEEYFFDFYKALPGAKQDLKAPAIRPDLSAIVE